MRYTSEYPIFYVTVDIVIVTVAADRLQVLLVERAEAPYAGRLALPGGFVQPDEDLLAAARRELEEETGVGGVFLQQLGGYGAPDRDPRGRVVSVAHLAILPEPVQVHAGSDAATAGWHPVTERLAETLAFDHGLILRDAESRLRSMLETTTVATTFVGEEFTLSELRHVYEVVWGAEFDPGNFQRKMRHTEDVFVPTGRSRLAAGGRGRPAGTFRTRSPGVEPLSTPMGRASSEVR